MKTSRSTPGQKSPAGIEPIAKNILRKQELIKRSRTVAAPTIDWWALRWSPRILEVDAQVRSDRFMAPRSRGQSASVHRESSVISLLSVLASHGCLRLRTSRESQAVRPKRIGWPDNDHLPFDL